MAGGVFRRVSVGHCDVRAGGKGGKEGGGDHSGVPSFQSYVAHCLNRFAGVIQGNVICIARDICMNPHLLRE